MPAVGSSTTRLVPFFPLTMTALGIACCDGAVAGCGRVQARNATTAQSAHTDNTVAQIVRTISLPAPRAPESWAAGRSLG